MFTIDGKIIPEELLNRTAKPPVSRPFHENLESIFLFSFITKFLNNELAIIVFSIN